MSWKTVSKDITEDNVAMIRLRDEAIAAAPPGFVKLTSNGEITSENTVAMLPRHPIKGHCRLCGKKCNLTIEHIPPKSSGNKERLQKLTFDDWLRDRLEINNGSKHKIEQGGIFGYTLCRDCNTLTGTLYGNEYKNWVERTKQIINGFGADAIAQMNKSVGPFGDEIRLGTKESGAVKPGAFVRQVLSCMCSLSGSWNLAERYPVLRRIILEQSKEALPTGFELGMALYVGPRVRILGPQLRIDVKTGIWRWCQEIAFPPFAFLLIIASNSKKPGLGLLIDKFTKVPTNELQYFSGITEIGFGWTPYPGDYRSEATIIAGRTNQQ